MIIYLLLLGCCIFCFLVIAYIDPYILCEKYTRCIEILRHKLHKNNTNIGTEHIIPEYMLFETLYEV